MTETKPRSCCTDTSEPPARDNPPGRDALRYRVGTHASFRQRMLDALARQHVPPNADPSAPEARRPLADLRTRAPEDPTIALIDAWACALDVLTFYDERQLQEGFLPTAQQRRSIHAIAQAIGYEPHPGVAASTRLAFTLDDGAGAPNSVVIPAGTAVMSVPTARPDLDLAPEDLLPQTYETDASLTARPEYNALPASTSSPQQIERWLDTLVFAGVSTRLEIGAPLIVTGEARAQSSGAQISERWDLRVVVAITTDLARQTTTVTLDRGLGTQSTAPASAEIQVFTFRERASLFGHNAPDWRSLPAEVQAAYAPAPAPAPPVKVTTWPNFSLAEDATTGAFLGQDPPLGVIDLDREYPKLVARSWICLQDRTDTELYRVERVSPSSRTDFTLATKLTRVRLDGSEHLTRFKRRSTVVHLVSEELELARVPDDSEVSGQQLRVHGQPTPMAKGRAVVIRGLDPNGVARAETRAVEAWAKLGDGVDSLVTFDRPLEHAYARATVELLGNVVDATHGQTVGVEAVGSGDAGASNQSFRLRQPPLTWVPGGGERGGASTLELRVDGVRWSETRDGLGLFMAGPRDRVYELHTSFDGETTLSFGDGQRGARLPTGIENVVARYRKGIGLAGEAAAGEIGLLLGGPAGIRGVQNPIPASGAADPEAVEDVRVNAPLTVLTLGRLVSVSDYEDFARSYAGIAKAQASELWNGKRAFVLVTVAGEDGAVLDVNEAPITALIEAIDAARDPTHVAVISPHVDARFAVALAVLADPDHLTADVEAGIRAALAARFGFAARQFAEPVRASQIVAAAHEVAGVVAVRLDRLHHVGAPAQGKPKAQLVAKPARWSGYAIQRAELLLIDTHSITITWMSP